MLFSSYYLDLLPFLKKCLEAILVFVLFTLICFAKIYAQNMYELIEHKEIFLRTNNDELIGSIFDMEITKDGNIFLCDYDNHLIWVFSKDGEYLYKIGNKGQGPGEFLRPISISIECDTVFVLDEGNQRVSLFSKTGKFLKAIPVSNAGMINGIEVSPNCEKYVISESLGIKNLTFFSIEGKVLSTFNIQPTGIMMPVKLYGGNISSTQTNKILCSNIRKYETVLLNWKGDTLQTFKAEPPGYRNPDLKSKQAFLSQDYFTIFAVPLEINNYFVIQRIKRFNQIGSSEKKKNEYCCDIFSSDSKPVQFNLKFKKLPFLATDHLYLYTIDYSIVENTGGNPSIIVAKITKN